MGQLHNHGSCLQQSLNICMHSVEISWGAVPQQMRRTAAYFENGCIYVSNNSEHYNVINASWHQSRPKFAQE